MNKPTHDDLWGMKEVHKELDDMWRHGNYVYQVFHRESDNTYWAISYEQTGDGEFSSFEEEEICQVRPVEKVITTIDWVNVEENTEN